MLSVNTNTGSMIALQYLNKTNAQLANTENQINTGLKVASAKDDGATYAIAQNMRADVAGYSAVTDSLNRGMSVVDVAMSAGQSISDLLIEMKQKAVAAADQSLSTTDRAATNEEFTALRDQITTIVQNAVFNGFDLVDGSATGGISALASSDGSRHITVASENMSLSGLGISGAISTLATASSMIATIQSAITSVNSSLARLSAGSKKFSIQSDFVSKLSDTLTSGIGNLVDADMAKESALLTALQTKQQLGVQALSIANSAPEIALSLFH
ncbi:MAG TPA: flagellin [Rhizomicrobium sp.]|jgi:flagellin|nr:flagellin [Rhizomicrobium sp.]